jgi:cytochrome c oxidase subunit 4
MAELHATAATQAGGHAGAEGGHATVATYVRIAVVLTVLTAIEVASLYIPGIPYVLLVVGLLFMSVLKFALVVGFYMHLRYDSPILALMALFSAFILLPRP